jgi:hypothetical protein
MSNTEMPFLKIFSHLPVLGGFSRRRRYFYFNIGYWTFICLSAVRCKNHWTDAAGGDILI